MKLNTLGEIELLFIKIYPRRLFMRNLFKCTLINCCLFSSVLAGTEEIEVELEPVVVTGSKTYRPSFNTEASSKNKLVGAELIERGINGVEDISQRVANFHLTNEGIGSFSQHFSMRGLTNTSIFSDPAVVFYVDDVPYASSNTTMGRLLHIESLEVYRSSQPGRFGKNAYAGAVDIKTRQPDNKLAGNLTLELGRFNLHQVSANVSGALIADQLYFTLSGEYQQRDGFLYNNYLNNRPDSMENFTGKATLKWTPTQAWDVRLILNKENFDYGATRLALLNSPDFFTVRSETMERLKEQSNNQSLRIAYNTDNYEILSITSHRHWHMNPRIVDLNLIPTVSNRIQNSVNQTWMQELRMRSKDKNSDWQWQAGLFYSNLNKGGVSDTVSPGFRAILELKKSTADTYAAFSQISYQGIKDTKAYFDLRVDYVNASVDAATSYLIGKNTRIFDLQQQDSTFFVSPKFGVDYTFSSNLMLYAATGLAFKPAGFAVVSTFPELAHFNKESSWQNEIGLKTNWFNQQVKLNLAGFYYDIENYQVERFFSNLDYGMANAAKAHSYGFEVESQAKLIENLWLETSLGYTHTQFDQHIDPITHANYAGKLAPFVPDFTSTVALQYKHPDGYFARAEWLWTGKTFFDESNTAIMSQNAYSTANLRIGYAHKNYSIYGFASNITDTHYYSYKVGGTRGTPGEPKMIGVRLGINF